MPMRDYLSTEEDHVGFKPCWWGLHSVEKWKIYSHLKLIRETAYGVI